MGSFLVTVEWNGSCRDNSDKGLFLGVLDLYHISSDLVGDTWEDVYLDSAARRQLLDLVLGLGALLICPLGYILSTYTLKRKHTFLALGQLFVQVFLHRSSNLVFDTF